MAERPEGWKSPQYEETRDPKNPPNSVVRPEVRKTALWVYLAPIVLGCVVVGIAAMYWSTRGPAPNADTTRTIGTVGDGSTPGGHDPDPRPDDTRAEVEYRGSGPLTTLGGMAEPRTAIGQRVALKDVEVKAANEPGTFLIEDGATEMIVVAPSSAPQVRAGMRADIDGVVEADGKGGARIRATHVAAR
jgi:hypothetical protein